MEMSKKRIAAITAAAIVAGGAQAKSRDPGPPDQRQVAPGQFDRIAVAGPFVVRVRTGEATSVSLSGPRTMLDDTDLFVRDGQLIIRWQEGAGWSRNGDRGVDIDITLPTLRGVMNAGAGLIDIDHVRAERFEATLVSAGRVSIESMDVHQLKAQLAGSGTLRAAGKAGTTNLTLASSGSFDSPDLVTRDADITSAGSGTIRTAVNHSANVKAFGSGGIELTGGAKCSVDGPASGHVRCS
jgi:hypothetical protein